LLIGAALIFCGIAVVNLRVFRWLNNRAGVPVASGD